MTDEETIDEQPAETEAVAEPTKRKAKAKREEMIEINSEGNGDVHVRVFDAALQDRLFRCKGQFTTFQWARPPSKKVTSWHVIDVATERFAQGDHPDGLNDTLVAKLRAA